jgi:DNA-binding NarL/FixJ family response regulator
MEKIKIALADDEALFRKGIMFILSKEMNMEIILEAKDGAELVHFLEHGTDLPDIILMDLKMPTLNGVETTKIISKQYPAVKIIALTSYHSNAFISNMIDVGASSYLIKNATPEEMIFTINEVFSKGFYYTDNVLNVIHQNINGTKKEKTHFDKDHLTLREKEILNLICLQFSTAEIANKLFLSTRTVEGHRNNLLLKTESKNMAGLVVYAIQNDFFKIDANEKF